jgi:hypothetical protein
MENTDYGLAMLALLESGSSEDVARETLARFPNLTATLAPPMRERFEAEARAKAEAARAASPEGQREALEREAAEADARAALAAKARDSLVRQGALDAEGAAALSDDEALWARGVERKPYERMTWDEKDREAARLLESGEYAAIKSPYERAAIASQLGTSLANFDEAAGISTADGADAGGEGSEG